MTTHYKAVRSPDAADFRTGQMVYEVGAIVKHPTSKKFGDMVPNDPGTYLSVSVEPAEVLIGGSWPCRLFEVKPIGKTIRRTGTSFQHKRGCVALKVVREIEAWRALGPQGKEVAEHIERCKTITRMQTLDLHAARDAAWDAALALLVRDLIEPAQFDLLYGPWKKVMIDG